MGIVCTLSAAVLSTLSSLARYLHLLHLFTTPQSWETNTMAFTDPESKIGHAQEVEHQDVYAEKALVADYKADAIEAENAEHNMTVLQAVKAYPMASFWAFVMSCTIVSYLHPTYTFS
jgi:hypothetical protein